MKLYMMSALLLCTVNSHAAVTVDCESKEYNYSPVVHDACVDMQETTTESRKKGNENFSEKLSEKKAAVKAVIEKRKNDEASTLPSAQPPVSSNRSHIMPAPSITPHPAIPAAPSVVPNQENSSEAHPATPPHTSTPQRNRGVNYN